MALKLSRKGRPNPEALLGAKYEITTATAAMFEGGGLRVDFDLLDDGEAYDLVRLTREKQRGPKQEQTWERLAAKAAGKPRAFDDLRALAELRAIGESVEMPKRRRQLDEAGSVHLEHAWVYDFLLNGVLWIEHLAALTFLLATFENGQGLSPSCELRDDGVLVFNTRMSLYGGRLDPDGRFTNFRAVLDHLATNQFIKIEKSGPTWLISKGLRLRQLDKRTRGGK